MRTWIKSNIPIAIAAWGFSTGAAGLVGFVASQLLPAEVKISSSGATVIVTLLVFFVVGAFSHVALTSKDIHFVSPRVYRFIPSNAGGKLLTAAAEWLGSSSTCSIYYLEGEFELLIGFGAVVTIQQDKKIQIAIRKIADGTSSYWSSIESNTGPTLTAIILKPGLPMEALNVGL
jgi:hypothetical protein